MIPITKYVKASEVRNEHNLINNNFWSNDKNGTIKRQGEQNQKDERHGNQSKKDIDLDVLSIKQQEYQKNYQMNYSFLNRRVVFYHCLCTLWIYRDKLKLIQKSQQQLKQEKDDQKSPPSEPKNRRPVNKGNVEQVMNSQSQIKKPLPTLTTEDLPNITFEDAYLQIGNQFIKKLKARQNSQGQIKYSDAFVALFQVNQANIFKCFISFLLQNVGRLSFSIILFNLFNAVRQQQIELAYILAVCGGIAIFIASLGRHNGFYQAALLNNRVRSAIIFTIYNQILNRSQYTIKKAELGKINNMLANDFNNLELKIPLLFAMLIFPVVVIALIIIMTIMLGYESCLTIVIALLLLPVQILVGKWGGLILTQINVHKDRRIKITTQVIQGIKFIKLYGWEIAFKKIIQQLRKKEIRSYIKMAVARALERSIANSSAYIAGFCTLATMHYSGAGLNNTIIFSLIELMVYLKVQIFFVAVGFGFVFQLNVVLQRFATIYNIKDKRMIRLDSQTRQPIVPQTLPKQKVQSNDINATNLDLAAQIQQQKPNNMAQFQIKIICAPQTFESLDLQPGQIRLTDFCAFWVQKQLQVPTLDQINLQFRPKKLYGIGGKVGSGKSALLGVLLRQVPYYTGNLKIRGSISYVEQEPVIFSTTIKENLVFGRPFDQQLYNQVLEASCLRPDLQIFQQGDQTIVGQKGMTLSGGQKARLSLARALYGNSDIYLFDDPLSAVDSKVAKQIFYQSIKKRLKDKTVILVTHQVHYLQQCDQLIILEGGKIKCRDKPCNLRQQINDLMAVFEDQAEQKRKKQQKQRIKRQQMIDGQEEAQQCKMIDFNSNTLAVGLANPRKGSFVSQTSDGSVMNFSNKPGKSESPIQGKAEVGIKTYARYFFFSKINYLLFPITFLFFISAEAINTIYFRFLATYDIQNDQNEQGQSFNTIDDFWLTLGLLQAGYFCSLFIKYFLLNITVLKSNEAIHQKMIYAMVRSPCSFFDVTPSGQLINKFSNDLGVLDNTLVYVMNDSIQMPLIMIVLVVNIFQINPIFIAIGVVNLAFMIFYFIYCKKATLASKQLDLTAKSPLFSSLSQMTSGLISLQIYHQKINDLKKFGKRVDAAFKANISFWFISRIFGVYLSYASNAFVLLGLILGIVAVTILYQQPAQGNGVAQQSYRTGLYGISAVFLIQINDMTQWFLRQLLSLESIMVSSQRSFRITELPSEAELYTDYDKQNRIPKPIQIQQDISLQGQQPNQTSSKQWPIHPKFYVKNMRMRYRPQLPLVLKKVSFQIEPFQKVGIVGRTGAGKSSIIQTLFRISQPSFGSLYQIDNLDVLKMGLYTLRQKMSVIPQTPFLFRGSIRQNLDPFEKQSQQSLWTALQEAGLRDYVEKLPKQLQTDVSSDSQIFSVGQKQLLCLARALIRKTSILFLDEATSNVDMKTDEFIQKVLKQKFKDTTIITIAHRLNTIADYDKVIVMAKGKVKECGTPYQLIKKQGIFFQMVRNTGKNADRIVQTAYETHIKRTKMNQLKQISKCQ